MKKLFSPIAIVLSLFFLVPAQAAAPDLPQSHSFFEEISYLMDKGVVKGYEDGRVQPERHVTRAEAAIMIGRLKGLNGTPQATGFSDVPKGHSASGFIAEAVKAGFLIGYPDNTYKPDTPIIRGDMAIILKRVFDLGLSFQNGFKDVSPNMKAYEPINYIIAANITAGYPDNTFRPLANVTRGQFSAFLARGLEPKFKNAAAIPNSYMKDKTKTYTYRIDGSETAVHRFVDVPDKDGLAYGFMWTVQIGSEVQEYAELENYQFIAFGWPYSEYDIALAYPVKAGKKFDTYNGSERLTNTITAINKTIATRYKTFNNATEVLTPDGTRYYMVPGHSTVKTVNAAGKVVFELISIR